REIYEDGTHRLTVAYTPSRLQRFLLRTPEGLTRKYELDPMGVQVLEWCDGTKSVRSIAKRFARTYGVNTAEAETAVIAFLRTMMTKGIVSMVVPKGATRG